MRLETGKKQSIKKESRVVASCPKERIVGSAPYIWQSHQRTLTHGLIAPAWVLLGNSSLHPYFPIKTVLSHTSLVSPLFSLIFSKPSLL